MTDFCKLANQKGFPFILPALPFNEMDLEPHMSAETFNYHHKKHHNAYVHNLNKLLEDSSLQSKTLEEIIVLTAGNKEKIVVFNNAAQVWNHSFFWNCMKKDGGGDPYGAIAKKIDEDFDSYEDFVTEFKAAATTQFGSGWAWLVIDDNNKLSIMKTSNADLPMAHNKNAILTLDVWEHAYYLDYQNLRPNYVESFLKHLVNWNFVNDMLRELMK
jgi:superoxide dismutase, Fe-Mn family